VFTVVFFRREIFDSRFIVLAAWVLAIFFIAISRALLRLLKRYLVSKGFGQHRVVLIGTKDSHRALVQEFNAKPGLGFHVIGSRPHINAETESWIVREHRRIGVDEIILTDANVRREDALKIMAFCEQNHISLMYTTDILGVSTLRLASHTFAGIPLLEVRRTPLDGRGKIYKRMFDIASALFLIVMTLPLQAVVTLLLALEQQGSVLFSRLPNGRPVTRIGENGKPFHFVKFRSMVKDAHVLRFDKDFIAANGNERGNSPLFKLKNDPRVTRIGRVLRRTSIDEIPQFYLVLAGKMSLIGPRPHLPEEVAEYKPEWRKVLNIKPGVTGMAQISGRADLDFEDEVRLDTFYIENWSPLLDLQILLKTPLAVFKAKGAK
ncbi:sugar transferase, partial [Candidatus Uhrbacteria bacterium]|nr:sugar transferase [Candidatus Uhrbacteria bacterium]